MKNLSKAVHDYLLVRRALGYKLEREGMWLPGFATFVHDHESAFITIELALKWAKQSENATPQSWAKRLTMVRRLAQYIHASDPRTEIPSRELIPCKTTRSTPYLYSEEEIQALLNASQSLKGVLMPYTYTTLLGLLTVTGIRIGEALNLNREDFDEHNELLLIKNSKFGKTREVPLHSTTVEALRAYAKRRDKLFSKNTDCPSFLLSQAGTRVRSQNVWRTFDRLRQEVKLNHAQRPSPRIHDLRHTFAVRTLLDWYQQGATEVDANLPLLSTYLGHVSPSSTYWYLSASPELLELAALRLDKTLGDLS